MFESVIKSAGGRPKADGLRADWPFVWKSIAGFWGLNLFYIVAQALLTGEAGKLFDPYRLAPIGFGIGLTLLMWIVLRASARLPLPRRLVIAALVSVPAAVAITTFAVAAVYLFDPALNEDAVTRTDDDGTVFKRLPSGELQVLREGESEPEVLDLPPMRQEFLDRAHRLIADESLNSFFFFFAWGAFYVAVSSGRRLQEAEGRAAEFERLAQESQLRALRYQINPHFLFNTLNSLSSLVMTKRSDEAEDMILSLSNFLRSTLTTDPTADVTLREEIALQGLYLDIERARFPDRLRVALDVPEYLESARVPALLLQPIVENVIKYAVARSRETVTLTIRARRDGGELTLVVENDVGSAGDAVREAGSGVGLVNVSQRLLVRYEGRARCSYGPTLDGGFRVTMTLPLIVG